MKYIELSFSFSQNTDFADIVVAKLNEIEFESYVETQDGVDAYIQESLFNQEKLNEVIEDLQSLFQFEYTIKEIKQENWNQQWEENFNPVEINKDCFIRAHFHDKIDCKYEIIITPKMSFGTGHHETTFLMMNEMFHIDFNNKKVLDMGCGTGILAILSKMLGSSITQAIDIDEWSYENSVENAILNNTEDINFSLGDVTAIKGTFDVVLANINRNIILEDISKYIDSLNENSDLLLSGFLSEDVIIIRDKVESLGLSFVSHKNKNKWNLLHFTN
ncbi:MAG: 50S ribosomal protein L11 methyltransferase [Flavobacteriales bacterium]|tara:strand:+ start:3696 stop:4520 length:825 start_codon:yes stop_codon:yes gene_type:complete